MPSSITERNTGSVRPVAALKTIDGGAVIRAGLLNIVLLPKNSSRFSEHLEISKLVDLGRVVAGFSTVVA